MAPDRYSIKSVASVTVEPNTENSGGLGRLLGSDYACGLCSTELEAPPGWQREPRVSCTIFCYSQPVNHQCCGQTALCGSDALRSSDKRKKKEAFCLGDLKHTQHSLPTMVSGRERMYGGPRLFLLFRYRVGGLGFQGCCCCCC